MLGKVVLLTMSENYQRTLGRQAEELGLRPDEIHTLEALCDDADYMTSDQLYATNARLASGYPHTDLYPIGNSTDYPETRPIQLLTVAEPSRGGVNAYIEGPGQASSRLAATTIAVTQELSARHPNIIRRFGYDGAVFCNNIDPDGAAMQEWTGTSLKEFFLRGYRGSWQDQVSWGYPAEGYTNVSAEARASLSVLQGYEPRYYASVQSALTGSYHRVSRQSPVMGEQLLDILESMGMVVNYQESESPSAPAISPGIFPVGNRATLNDDRKAAAPQEIRNAGTSALDHIPKDALMHIPEVAWAVSDYGSRHPDSSSGVIRGQAVQDRNAHIQRLTENMHTGLQAIDPWVQDNNFRPDVRRLHDAAQWYGDVVPTDLQAEAIQTQRSSEGEQVLTRFQHSWVVGFHVCSALVYAGNVHRLATMASNEQVATNMLGAIEAGLAVVGPTHIVPVSQQVGTQVLSLLSGMRHA